MKKTSGFALIGCGAIARMHSDVVANIDNAKMVGVYDTAYAYAEKFAEERGCKAFADLDEMLACPEIDIVSICTPSGLHAPLAVKVANAKKHLIIEKPMGITHEQTDAIIEAVERNQVKAEVITQMRFTHSIRTLKDAIDTGLLGKILLADFKMKYYRSPEYYSVGWRGTWDMDGGGALMNQGVHGIDLIQYLMGGVKSVYADCRTMARDIEVEDTANLLLEYNNGAIGVIQATTVAEPGYPRKLEVHGERGTVVVQEDAISVWDVKGMEKPDFGVSSVNSGGSAMDFSWEYHKLQFLDLMEAIEEDRATMVDVYEGKKPVDIILAAYESSRTGKKIFL